MRARVEQLEKGECRPEVKRKEELDEAEQRSYDFCFEEHVEAVKKIQGQLFQAGYDFGLNEAFIPSTSALGVPVSIPGEFKYMDEDEDEDEDEEEDGDDESSQTGYQEGVRETLAGGAAVAQEGGNADGTTVANDV